MESTSQSTEPVVNSEVTESTEETGTHFEEEKKSTSALKQGGDTSMESIMNMFRDLDPSKMNP